VALREKLINAARLAQDSARQFDGAADPASREQFKQWSKRARDAGRAAAEYLPPGGELRERLLSGELISEEDWERLCGPTPW
jgi:hypothetical protein